MGNTGMPACRTYLPTQDFYKKTFHLSGYTIISSLHWHYKLKDASGILQPRLISFG